MVSRTAKEVNTIALGNSPNERLISGLAVEGAILNTMPGWRKMITEEHGAAMRRRRVQNEALVENGFGFELFSTKARRDFRNTLSSQQMTRGNAVVGEGFIERTEIAHQNYPLFKFATVERRKGNPVKACTVDVTVNRAVEVTENATQSYKEPGFSLTQVNMRTFLAMWAMPAELNEDSPELVAQLPDIMGMQLAAGKHYTFINKVQSGLLAQATNVNSASSGVVGGDDIEDLIAAVGSKYIENARFLMTGGTWRTLRKQRSGDGNFIWARANNGGRWLNDFPVELTEDMPSLATGNSPILFGDLGRVLVIESDSIRVKPDEETLASTDGTLWKARHRAHCTLMNTGSLVALAKLTVA